MTDTVANVITVVNGTVFNLTNVVNDTVVHMITVVTGTVFNVTTVVD